MQRTRVQVIDIVRASWGCSNRRVEVEEGARRLTGAQRALLNTIEL